MYTPKNFHIEDETTILKYIKEREFGTLITSCNGMIENSHLPFYFKKEGKEVFLYAHFSRANEHWKIINDGVSIISFLSADTYISHNDYNTKVAVPTWNYAALTVHGKCEILNNDETEDVIIELLKIHESENHNIDNALITKLSKMVVGLKFKVSKYECKFKFSQNRAESDFLNMLSKLEESDNIDDKKTYQFIKEYEDSINKY